MGASPRVIFYMDTFNISLRIESLIQKVMRLGEAAQHQEGQDIAIYTVECLDALLRAHQNNTPVFGVEPWHMVGHCAREGGSPGEYLLRLNDVHGYPLSPYPAIMMFYENNLEAEIDTVLFLCALFQFYQDSETQISFNISARSFFCADFITTILGALEGVGLGHNSAEKIIFEIHESASNMVMSQSVLESFKCFGAAFAIDDVGLSMGDVFRLSEFESMADYVKIDRSCVCGAQGTPHALMNAVSLVQSLLPNSVIVAEGVQSPEHALEIYQKFPNIEFVQGMHLPPRTAFAEQYYGAKMLGAA